MEKTTYRAEGITMTEREAQQIYHQEKALIQALQTRQLNLAKKALNALLANVFMQADNNLDYLKDRCAELITLMSRAVIKSTVKDAFSFGYESRATLSTIRVMDDLLPWMNHVLKCFFGFLEDVAQDEFITETAMAFMTVHARENITLAQVAKEVYLSPDYFSRRFKAKTGMTFSQCMQRIRVNASKELLNDYQYTLSEIAQMFQFSDQSHFTRVFKRVVGVTPSRFRDAQSARQRLKPLVAHG